MNYKMILQYEGTRFDGWQKQKNTERTVQGKLEQVLSRLAGQEVEVQGAGRTDAGVHALGQTASFRLDTELKDGELKEAPPRFHARLNACWKVYRYHLAYGEQKPVFDRRLVYRLEQEPDFEAMKKAARFLVGTHDFRAFCANKHMKKSTVRTVYDIRIEDGEKPGRASIRFCGDGFLYHMVRILTGTLLEVGYGKRREEDMEKILESGDRAMAGFTAPPEGLFLEKVSYDKWERTNDTTI